MQFSFKTVKELWQFNSWCRTFAYLSHLFFFYMAVLKGNQNILVSLTLTLTLTLVLSSCPHGYNSNLSVKIRKDNNSKHILGTAINSAQTTKWILSWTDWFQRDINWKTAKCPCAVNIDRVAHYKIDLFFLSYVIRQPLVGLWRSIPDINERIIIFWTRTIIIICVECKQEVISGWIIHYTC